MSRADFWEIYQKWSESDVRLRAEFSTRQLIDSNSQKTALHLYREKFSKTALYLFLMDNHVASWLLRNLPEVEPIGCGFACFNFFSRTLKILKRQHYFYFYRNCWRELTCETFRGHEIFKRQHYICFYSKCCRELTFEKFTQEWCHQICVDAFESFDGDPQNSQ